MAWVGARAASLTLVCVAVACGNSAEERERGVDGSVVGEMSPSPFETRDAEPPEGARGDEAATRAARSDAGSIGARSCADGTLCVPGDSPDASAPRDGGTAACWQLPVIDRVRLYPAPGKASALLQGKIEGSSTSAMNGFVELARITQSAGDGQWVELRLSGGAAYRYVKYHAPAGSFGALAELELYAGQNRVGGMGFGTAGSRGAADTTYGKALDGNAQSFFEAPLADDQYVGLDVAAGHVAATPTFRAGMASSSSQTVELLAANGAEISFTTDGRDPKAFGTRYTGPITLPAGSTLLRAIATQPCMVASEVAQQLFQVGSSTRTGQSSIHIGNSLTDTIVDYLQPIARSGGVTLDFNRYTIPGAGTWLYQENPSGGFGVPNVREALRTRAFDHLTAQPFPNMPCQALPSADGNDSDSGFIQQMWTDARTQNPNVQLWVYQQWPAPREYSNCISGGGWTRGGYAPPAPKSWEEAVANELRYHESVRAELVRLIPGTRPPYIIPAGNALVALKRAIESGAVPGLTDFFAQIYADNGTDLHMTRVGSYYVSLVFYACMFQKSPAGLVPEAGFGVSAAQAPVLQRLAWETVTSYPLSGVTR